MNVKHPLLSLDERVSTHDLGKAVAVTQHTPALGRSALALGSEPRWIGSDSKEETKSGPETAHRWLTRDKKLVEKLALLLKYQNPPVTDLNSASQGLRDFGQFISAVDASHTLRIPFHCVKTQMLATSRLGNILNPDTDR